jgi:hypothetical protein
MKHDKRWMAKRLNAHVVVVLLLLAASGYHRGGGILGLADAVNINALSQRIDNPSPPGAGTVFLRLQADPADPHTSSLAGFKILTLTLLQDQSVKLWNVSANNCDGATLASYSFGSPPPTIPLV